ncbi:MAG: carbohydrate kinase family protein [Candidatus Moranbacteria bacterium]|nr:carbohydrate kinase family protein [Candidatus Moranbacteria bacterium]
MKNMYDIISIGSVVKDIFVITDRGKIFKTPKDKLAPVWLGFELGEKIRAEEIKECLGGVASNLAIGAKKMGMESSLISTVGSDYPWLKKELEENKIDVSYLAASKSQEAFSVILVDKKSGERVIIYNKASGNIAVDKLSKLKTRWLSVSSLTGKWSKQADQIVKYVAKNKTGLILLPSTSQIRDDFSDLKKLLEIAKILILNKNEALEIAAKKKARTNNIKDLFKFLHAFGPEIVCVTDGSKGAWASNEKNILHSPILKVKAVDVTGAGDAFAAGFLGFYLKGKSLEDSLRAGIVNSASVVKYIGTTPGLLVAKEIARKAKNISTKKI